MGRGGGGRVMTPVFFQSEVLRKVISRKYIKHVNYQSFLDLQNLT